MTMMAPGNPVRLGARLLKACVCALGVLAAPDPAAAADDAAILAARPPALLSQFGFFADMARQVPAEGVLPFKPATPLFTDFAVKRRFVYVPAGQSARYDPQEALDFPVGSALVKTFAYLAEERPGGLRLVETRVLLRQQAGWQAWAYVWDEQQSDAELNLAGARIPMEVPTLDGRTEAITYAVPNKNQCKGCHAINGEVTPIGPKARNLNHAIDFGDGPQNQLARWAQAGILTGLPEVSQVSSVPDWLDTDAPLDARARAWLDINCAHCHRREGAASNSGLFLTWGETDRVALGVNKRPVAAGRGAGDLSFDIVPGDPEASILLYRVESAEAGIMMPELGRSLVDPRAVTLLREWIAAMR
ncbi:MAG: hypothetical protein K8H74_16040 [Notoacmeibacter sp.]|nr:hypothetical protein [Notoacmeibacter sp.]